MWLTSYCHDSGEPLPGLLQPHSRLCPLRFSPVLQGSQVTSFMQLSVKCPTSAQWPPCACIRIKWYTFILFEVAYNHLKSHAFHVLFSSLYISENKDSPHELLSKQFSDISNNGPKSYFMKSHFVRKFDLKNTVVLNVSWLLIKPKTSRKSHESLYRDNGEAARGRCEVSGWAQGRPTKWDNR